MNSNSMKKQKHTVFLVHWKAEQAAEKLKLLKKAGYDSEYRPITPQVLRDLRAAPPDIIVIDLSRLPSQGRDIALNFRQYKSTRFIPLIFVDGEPEKLAKIKTLLPDAIYTTWKQIAPALKKAIDNPLKNPIAAKSSFDAYVGVPLAGKLGIKPNMPLVLIDPPADIMQILGDLPEGVIIQSKIGRQNAFILWFVTSVKELGKMIGLHARALEKTGRLWVAWPKRSSGLVTGLNQIEVRRAGLAIGLVDYKICSIDEIWSALLFTWRKKR
jgi:CheY-like chemotaxis protein